MAKETKSGTTDSASKTPTESADKGKSLAELLEEYEAQTQTAAAKKVDDKATDELKALRDEVAQLRSAEASRNYRKEMDSVLIPTIKGDLDIHPKLVESWINEQADQDPRLMKLWEDRANRPREFKAAIEALKPEFEAYAEKEGLKGTAKPKESQDKGLKSAIRSARSTQSAPADLNNVNLSAMSDTEFAMHKQEIFRLAQTGELH